MLLERRPVAEVLSREADTDLVNLDLPCKLLGNGVSHSEVLESQIADILEIAAVDLVQLCASVVCQISDWTREVCVRIILAPAILEEVLRKV